MGEGADDGLIEAIVDIQRRSLEAAASLVDRFVTTPAPAGGAASSSEERQPADLVGGWAQMVRESLATFAPTAPAGTQAPPSFEVGGSRETLPLALTVPPCGTGAVEVWIHNRTDAAMSGLRPWCTAPSSHLGVPIRGDAVTFDPEVVDLEARSSRGIQVTVAIGDIPPGRYHGLVQVVGLAEQCLVLVVDVPVGDP